MAKTRLIFETIRQPTSHTLPAGLSREIGRLIVKWTYLEHYIQAMIWAISFNGDGLGAKLGRIAIREPSSKESRLDLLQWVAEVRGVKLDEQLLRSIKKRTKSLSNTRNLVAHGAWTNVPGAGWAAQQTRGAWEDFKGGPKGSRRITPQAVPISVDYLRKIITEVDEVIADVRTLKGKIGES